MPLIEELTPEQEALIPIYQEKWQAIAFSTRSATHPTDQARERQKVKAAIDELYTISGYSIPETLFFDSPYAALQRMELLFEMYKPLWKSIDCSDQLEPQFELYLWQELEGELFHGVGDRIHSQLYSNLAKHLQDQLRHKLTFVECARSTWDDDICSISRVVCDYIEPERWAALGCLYDFCISVLNCQHHARKWQIHQDLMPYCEWLIPYEFECVVCARPTTLCFDTDHRLHAEGGPAVEYADGYCLYSLRGRTYVPEKA
jgi:hypothetical protein